MSVVTLHLVGGILDEVNTISLMDPLLGHWSTLCMAHPPITAASRIPIEGLVTSTWCFHLRMDFDMEILSSPLFSPKMEVGTAASSCFNTSFRLIVLVLINAVTLANINPESDCSIGSTDRFFLPSFLVRTFLLIVC